MSFCIGMDAMVEPWHDEGVARTGMISQVNLPVIVTRPWLVIPVCPISDKTGIQCVQRLGF